MYLCLFLKKWYACWISLTCWCSFLEGRPWPVYWLDIGLSQPYEPITIWTYMLTDKHKKTCLMTFIWLLVWVLYEKVGYLSFYVVWFSRVMKICIFHHLQGHQFKMTAKHTPCTLAGLYNIKNFKKTLFESWKKKKTGWKTILFLASSFHMPVSVQQWWIRSDFHFLTKTATSCSSLPTTKSGSYKHNEAHHSTVLREYSH